MISTSSLGFGITPKSSVIFLSLSFLTLPSEIGLYQVTLSLEKDTKKREKGEMRER